ncbi:DUF3263 domain-containing protein [Mycobacterium intracellulare]|uniref:DUF3263 domain-containing protein n=1 Tax=Mycobacterium intracellulare TaxID=1767 RepID=UPI0018C8AE22|nr:DUF3263 domain-containing protein [Mycobacterium intracellulare]
MDSLTEQQRAIIDMERQRWATVGGKETAVPERFSTTPICGYQLTIQVLASAFTPAYDPLITNQLRRIRLRRKVCEL